MTTNSTRTLFLVAGLGCLLVTGCAGPVTIQGAKSESDIKASDNEVIYIAHDRGTVTAYQVEADGPLIYLGSSRFSDDAGAGKMRVTKDGKFLVAATDDRGNDGTIHFFLYYVPLDTHGRFDGDWQALFDPGEKLGYDFELTADGGFIALNSRRIIGDVPDGFMLKRTVTAYALNPEGKTLNPVLAGSWERNEPDGYYRDESLDLEGSSVSSGKTVLWFSDDFCQWHDGCYVYQTALEVSSAGQISILSTPDFNYANPMHADRSYGVPAADGFIARTVNWDGETLSMYRIDGDTNPSLWSCTGIRYPYPRGNVACGGQPVVSPAGDHIFLFGRDRTLWSMPMSASRLGLDKAVKYSVPFDFVDRSEEYFRSDADSQALLTRKGSALVVGALSKGSAGRVYVYIFDKQSGKLRLNDSPFEYTSPLTAIATR
jgi:hypothetical protein